MFTDFRQAALLESLIQLIENLIFIWYIQVSWWSFLGCYPSAILTSLRHESRKGRNTCSKRGIFSLLDVWLQTITQATASICQTVVSFEQDRSTQNKLSILNGIHIMTLYTVSHFDNILPQNLHDPGRKEKEGCFSFGFGFSRAEKEFLFQEIQPYPYTYSNRMPHSHWFEMLFLEIALKSHKSEGNLSHTQIF